MWDFGTLGYKLISRIVPHFDVDLWHNSVEKHFPQSENLALTSNGLNCNIRLDGR